LGKRYQHTHTKKYSIKQTNDKLADRHRERDAAIFTHTIIHVERSSHCSAEYIISVCLSICLPFYLSVFLSLCLTIYLPFYLSVYLPFCLPVCLSVFLQFYLSACINVHSSVFESVCYSKCLSAYLSAIQSESACMSLHLSASLSFCLSVSNTQQSTINSYDLIAADIQPTKIPNHHHFQSAQAETFRRCVLSSSTWFNSNKNIE
jgi:hypothetical protein